tara:strand:- start:202226 stop:202450 length:225 start_codon:yes stop_codon:yes gene_type:complete
MARGRIFSSRRMFSSRRSSFAEPSKNAGPLGVVIGLTAAGLIIFGLGVYTGRTFPAFMSFSAPAPVQPVTATEF